MLLHVVVMRRVRGCDALGYVRADSGCDDGAEVRAQAIEVREGFCDAGVGETKWKQRPPGLFHFGGATAEVERGVLGVVCGHVGSVKLVNGFIVFGKRRLTRCTPC